MIEKIILNVAPSSVESVVIFVSFGFCVFFVFFLVMIFILHFQIVLVRMKQ